MRADDGMFHLKSAVTVVESDRVLCNPAWIDMRVFRHVDAIPVDSSEPFAANVLLLGHTIVCAASHERTTADLRRAATACVRWMSRSWPRPRPA